MEERAISGCTKKAYIAVLLAAGVVYVFSCAPGLLWQDSGMIQYRVWHNDIEGGLGLALAHPLFYILAIGIKSLPFGDFPSNINLISSIAAAVTVANVFLLLKLWLGKSLPAVIAAITLAVSHTFWRHASIVETYTLYTALFTAGLVFLWLFLSSRNVKWLYLLGLANGLAVANHMFGIIPLACYAVMVLVFLIRREIRWVNALIFATCWIAGAMPYEILIVQELVQSGDLFGTLRSAAFGSSWQGAVLNSSMSTRILQENVLFMGMNFPTPNLILALAGLAAVFKASNRAWRNMLVVITLLFLVFAGRYTVPDRYAFFIPFYVMVSILVGAGFAWLAERVRSKWLAAAVLGLAVVPAVVYVWTPEIGRRAAVFEGKREIPYRDNYEFFLQPWKTGYRGADRFASEALGQVEENAIIFADGTTAYPLLLKQEMDGLRLDVLVAVRHGSVDTMCGLRGDALGNVLQQETIYAIGNKNGYHADTSWQVEFIRTGILYQVVRKQHR